MVYLIDYTFVFDLVSTTVTGVTARTIEVVNIERAAVSHLNAFGPITTA